MAFEQQLEADRIDDFNLFSAFVRVPLLILEGVLGQQEKDETNERLEDNCERSTLPPSSESKPQNENAPARTISNEDLSNSPTTQRTPLSRLETKSNQSLTRRSSHTSLNNLIGSPNGRKSRRKASWSDESGHNLVEYLDESVKHEPISPYQNLTSTKAPVIKSAMKRSRSIRNQSLDDPERRYIPNMNQGANNGIIMPARPYQTKDAPPPAGEFSPQWGWYTSLTPPDVMYSAAKNHKRSATEPVPRMSIPEQKTHIIKDENQANQVFQSLQNSQAPVAWTSVPI